MSSNGSVKEALAALRGYMIEKGYNNLKGPNIGEFYSAHSFSCHKGKVLKKNIAQFGDEYGLEWADGGINKLQQSRVEEAAIAAAPTASALRAAPAPPPPSDLPCKDSILDMNVGCDVKKYLAFSATEVHISDEKPTMSDNNESNGFWNEQDFEKLKQILPTKIVDLLPAQCDLTEIILDYQRPPMVRFLSGEVSDLGSMQITKEDLKEICAHGDVGTFSSDNRAGIDATLHRISQKKNRSDEVIGLTLRVGRAVQGATGMISDIVHGGKSVLLLGIPGVGKTTLLREYARLVADDRTRVEVVDTSNEIAGDGDAPHPSVGRARRMMVNNRELQYKVMIEAVQNHMPEVIVVDEIGTRQEVQAVTDIAQRGVKVVATAHGTKLAELLANPELSRLLGGVHTVVLSDAEAKARKQKSKSVRERKGPPVFDIIVELRNSEQWNIYHNVMGAVDDILADRKPVVEVRRKLEGGLYEVYKTQNID